LNAAHVAIAGISGVVMQHCAFVVPTVSAAFAMWVESQAIFGVWPPHFVVSDSQQAPAEHEAACEAHIFEAAVVFAFIPAAHVAAAHVDLAVQQAIFWAAASAPPAMPAFMASLYFPEAQTTAMAPHFVVSFSQHVA